MRSDEEDEEGLVLRIWAWSCLAWDWVLMPLGFLNNVLRIWFGGGVVMVLVSRSFSG